GDLAILDIENDELAVRGDGREAIDDDRSKLYRRPEALVPDRTALLGIDEVDVVAPDDDQEPAADGGHRCRVLAVHPELPKEVGAAVVVGAEERLADVDGDPLAGDDGREPAEAGHVLAPKRRPGPAVDDRHAGGAHLRLAL